MRKILYLIICSVFLISGCGSSGGGAQFFETVIITADCETTSLDSDIMVWKLEDPNDGLNDPCDINGTFPDTVNITINSGLYSPIDSEIPYSSVEIENVLIDYEPVSNTPSLASRFLELGQTVDPNNSIMLEIPIMHTQQKRGFLENPVYYAELIDGMAFYTYNVILTFRVVEIDSDKSGEVKTGLTVILHDFTCSEVGGPNCDDKCYHDPEAFRP
ncbi:MAG: hypothetical protein ACMUIU_08855 [bacterium]